MGTRFRTVVPLRHRNLHDRRSPADEPVDPGERFIHRYHSPVNFDHGIEPRTSGAGESLEHRADQRVILLGTT